MSEIWHYLIIHSCLHLYISLQKWHLTLEHLSLHLKPRGICPFSMAASVTVHPKWQCRKSGFTLFSGSLESSCKSMVSFARWIQFRDVLFIQQADRKKIVGETKDMTVILWTPMNTFRLKTMRVQAYGAGVIRKIRKDSDCCQAGSLTRSSDRNTAVRNRWTARR